MSRDTQAKALYMSIPEPCSQSWDSMSPNDKGRYCAHCRKTVIDFTTWSDTSLYNFLAKNNDRVCGRFRASQLHGPITVPYQPHSKLYKIAMALGLTLLVTQSPDVMAQNRTPLVWQIDSARHLPPGDPGYGELGVQILTQRRTPVKGVLVRVSQCGIVRNEALTDSSGNYLLRSLAPGTYDILVSDANNDSASAKEIQIKNGLRTIVHFTVHSAGQLIDRMPPERDGFITGAISISPKKDEMTIREEIEELQRR
jgi:Carboxypeptidase regulatory-like domain